RQLRRALAFEHDRPVAARHLELVPEVERRAEAVEPRPEVRRRRRRADDDLHRATPARIESTLGCTTIVGSASTSTAAVSFRPWPVSTATTVLPGSSSTCLSPA